jgi:hypothetical protein
MARAKRSHPKTKVNIRRRKAGQREPTWHWRLGSLLMAGAIGFVLAPKSVAEAAELKAPVKPQLNVVDIGDLYSYGYATSSASALRKSVPPTLQALNQVQAANSGVRLKVLFIPVPAATSSALFDSGNNELPALINAVAHSSVVIVGLGGGNTPLAGSMRSVLFGTAAPADAFPQLMNNIDDGYYLYNQEGLLSAIAAHAAPGTSIVTLGYPAIAGKQGTSGFSWWSPYTWGTVSQAQANMSDQLVSALNTADGQATSMVAAAHPDLHFLYADLSGAMVGTGPSASATGSQQGQTRPTNTTIGSDLLPYVSQAAGNKLVTMNVHAAQGTPLVTSASPWQLSVVLPVSAPKHTTAAATPSPQNNQDNPSTPVYEPLVWPGFPAQPSRPAAGGLPPGGAGSGGPAAAASPAVGSTSTAQGGNDQGQPVGHDQRLSAPGYGQPTVSANLPTLGAKPTPGDHPTGGLQLPIPTQPARPSVNGTSASTGDVKAGPIVTPTPGADSGNNRSPSATPPKKTPSPGNPPALPMIPAPPASLPKPITTAAPAPGTGSEPTGAPGTTPTATPPNKGTTSQPPASSQPPGNGAPAPMASPSTTPSAGQPVTPTRNPVPPPSTPRLAPVAPTSPTTPTTPATTPGAPAPSTGSDAVGSPGTTPTATPPNTVTPPTVATPPSTPASATPAAGTPTAGTPTPATPTAGTPTAATPAPPTPTTAMPTAAIPAAATPAAATGGGSAPGNSPGVSGLTAPSGSTAPAPGAAS